MPSRLSRCGGRVYRGNGIEGEAEEEGGEMREEQKEQEEQEEQEQEQEERDDGELSFKS